VTVVSSKQFTRELKPQAKIFELRAAFKPVEAEADDSPWMMKTMNQKTSAMCLNGSA